MIAADRFEYSSSCSKTIQTARARTSVENLFALLFFSIGSIHTYFGASGKQGAVQLKVVVGQLRLRETDPPVEVEKGGNRTHRCLQFSAGYLFVSRVCSPPEKSWYCDLV
jgi:hypothetical protein